MSKVIYTDINQSLWDITVKEYGSIEGFFDLIDDNEINSLDHVPDFGKTMLIDTSLVFKNKFEYKSKRQPLPETYNIIVEHDQNLWDLIIQEFGSINQAFDFIKLNEFKSFDDSLLVGDKFICSTDFNGDYDAMKYFRGKRKVVTGGKQEIGGIGFMRIGGNFKVS